MGRLIRKKTGSKKKKKQNGDLSPGNGNGAAVSKSSLSSEAGGAQKKRIVSQKKSHDAAKSSPGGIRIGFIEKSMQFLREVKAELKKVAWPTRKQTLGSTAVVIVLVMIISFFLGLVDVGLNYLIRAVI